MSRSYNVSKFTPVFASDIVTRAHTYRSPPTGTNDEESKPITVERQTLKGLEGFPY